MKKRTETLNPRPTPGVVPVPPGPPLSDTEIVLIAVGCEPRPPNPCTRGMDGQRAANTPGSEGICATRASRQAKLPGYVGGM